MNIIELTLFIINIMTSPFLLLNYFEYYTCNPLLLFFHIILFPFPIRQYLHLVYFCIATNHLINMPDVKFESMTLCAKTGKKTS